MNNIIINRQAFIREAEEKGWVTRTFRRLDADRQEAVILAILEEAAENGPDEINIKMVAERSRAAVGSLYQYFGSRERLVIFAVELTVRETVSLFEQYTDMLAAMPLRQALEAYLGGGVEWSREQAGMARLFARAAYQGAPGMGERVVRPIAEVLTNMMREILIAARERGELRADLDLEAAARLLNALMIAIGDAQIFPHINIYFRLYDDDLPIGRVLDVFFRMLEGGLQAGSES